MGWPWRRKKVAPKAILLPQIAMYCVEIPRRNGAQWARSRAYRFNFQQDWGSLATYLEDRVSQEGRQYIAHRLVNGEILVNVRHSALDSIQVDVYTRQRDIPGNGPVVDELWFSSEALANAAAGAINAALYEERLNRKAEREEGLASEHGELSGYPTDLLIDGR